MLKKQDAILQVARLWPQAGLLGNRAGQRGAGAGAPSRLGQFNLIKLNMKLNKDIAFLQVARLWAQAGLLGDRAGQRGAGAGLAARHAKGRDGTVTGAHALAALRRGQHQRRGCRGENLHENQKRQLYASSGFFGALSLVVTPWQPFAVVNTDGVVTGWASGFAMHSPSGLGVDTHYVELHCPPCRLLL